MNDTEQRLRKIVALLRRGEHLRVDDLACATSVSRRTILRDIGRLRDRGYLIDSESGPGGGVVLDPSSVWVSARLSTIEAVSLILTVSVFRGLAPFPYGGTSDAALARIEAALPPDRVTGVREMMRRIVIADPAPVSDTMGPGDTGQEVLNAFETAFVQRRVLRLRYRDRVGKLSVREVEPQGLLIRFPLWYVLSFEPAIDDWRLFRMDRIETASVLLDRGFRLKTLRSGKDGCPQFSARLGEGR